MGDGKSDSSIDVILSSTVCCDGTPSPPSEHLLGILCRNQDSRISNSHHDAIITKFALSHLDTPAELSTDEIPTEVNRRHRIIWSDESLQAYCELVIPVLAQLREDWLVPTSPSCMSILLQHTNTILTSAAKSTQKVIDLSLPTKPKVAKPPAEVSEAARRLKKAHDHHNTLNANPAATAHTIEVSKTAVSSARSALQKLKRKSQLQDELSRDANLHRVLSSDSKLLFSSIKSSKKAPVQINKLNVGNEVFTGENVGKGFFKSIKSLKTKDPSLLECPTYRSFLGLHHHILDICKAGEKIPLLSFKNAKELLKSVKPGVSDFYSISALHYINGGDEGVLHFQLLLNAILSEVENFAISEMNKVWAIVLHKGHGKDKNSDRSYRTISSCPFLAKCADKYIGNLSEPSWSAAKAETQFQSKGLSHEHAAILLTETVNHSLYVNKQPVFCLLLDAKSAFDRALREVLTTRMYLDGTSGHSLLYLDKRLESRETYIEWDKTLMGPIKDQQGVEQGGQNSSEQYKLYNNEQFTVAQDSNLGVSIGPVTISSIGQADDSALTSCDFHQLAFLLQLTVNYCKKYKVEMTPEKTKLLIFSPTSSNTYATYYKNCNYLSINTTPLANVPSAEHVGIVRAISGNLPHILKRISSHKKALASVLSSGMSRHHRGNPAASLRVEKLYGLPVLLSGVAALVLLQSELEILAHHYKVTLQGLLRLHRKTPESVVFFLGGSLPFPALLHLRQLTLFCMILQLPDNILNTIARYVLTRAPDSAKSWFFEIKSLCYQYNLPHPLLLLEYPPDKENFKETVKLRILDFWQQKLRQDAAPLTSLEFFHPQYMSLSSPLWLSCGGNPYEVQKAVVQSRMLSGRYRDDHLTRHFTGKSGECSLCLLLHPDVAAPEGDLFHILLLCPALETRRSYLLEYWATISSGNEVCCNLTQLYQTKPDKFKMQFLLDCAALPQVIEAVQQHGNKVSNLLYKMTRTYCYSIHRDRLKQLGRWS